VLYEGIVHFQVELQDKVVVDSMAPIALANPQTTPTYKTGLASQVAPTPQVQSHQDTGLYEGYDHVHWYVGNAKQAGKSAPNHCYPPLMPS